MSNKIKIFSGWEDPNNGINYSTITQILHNDRKLHLDPICDYSFNNINFFSVVDNWQDHIINGAGMEAIANLARILWIKKYIDEGYHTVGWIDADIILTNNFKIPEFTVGACTTTISGRYHNSMLFFNNTEQSYKELCEFIDYGVVEILKDNIHRGSVGLFYLNNKRQVYDTIIGGEYVIKNMLTTISPDAPYINISFKGTESQITERYNLFKKML